MSDALIRAYLLEAALEKAGLDKDKFGKREAEKLSTELKDITDKIINERTFRNHVNKLRYEQTWGYLAAFVLSPEFTLEELRGEKEDFFPAYERYSEKVKDQILSEKSNTSTYNLAVIFSLILMLCFLAFLFFPRKEKIISVYADPHPEDQIINKHLIAWASLMSDALPYKFELSQNKKTSDVEHTVLYYTGENEAHLHWQNLLTNIPFGLDFLDYQDWYWNDATQLMLDTLMLETGVRFVPLGNTGSQSGGWFIVKDTIQTIEDLKGYNVRMFGLGADVVEKSGCCSSFTDRNFTLEEICKQIENHKGKFAFEYINAGVDVLLRYDSVQYCDYVIENNLKLCFYEKGWHEPSTSWNLKFPMEIWDKFTKNEKAIIQTISKAVTEDIRRDYQEVHQHQMKQWKDLDEQDRLGFILLEQLPENLLNNFQKSAKTLFDNQYISLKGTTSERLFRSYNDYLIKKKGNNLLEK